MSFSAPGQPCDLLSYFYDLQNRPINLFTKMARYKFNSIAVLSMNCSGLLVSFSHCMVAAFKEHSALKNIRNSHGKRIIGLCFQIRTEINDNTLLISASTAV